MNIVIRSERTSDIPAVRRVHLMSFPSEAEANLVDRLREQGKAVVALVAEAEHGAVVGHVLFSPVHFEHPTGRGNYVGLAPIAVLPEFRNQGIGTQLVREGLDQCGRFGYHGVVVLGEPSFYSRCEFRPASEVGLSCPFGGGDAFQVYVRVPRSYPRDGAIVHYDEEFNQLDASPET
ncbi:MAG: N-acetyltransferase [Planctomycetales bacterium]|nr:N-acetyltransferase [Planctomycetales bacterium]